MSAKIKLHGSEVQFVDPVIFCKHIGKGVLRWLEENKGNTEFEKKLSACVQMYNTEIYPDINLPIIY